MKILCLLFFGFCFLSVLDVFPDPYYHKTKVNFWVWCARELDEELHGERREGI